MKKITYLLLLLVMFWMPTVFAANVAVDINVASAKELSTALNGIGLSKAQAIVNYREKNGKFTSVKDLLKIKGIGPKILLKNEALLQIDSEQ